jgi:hypothetical protein
MTTHSAEQVRAIAKDVAKRAQSDPAYMEQLETDPVGTLSAAGMPSGGVVEWLIENTENEDDVSGYLSTVGFGAFANLRAGGMTGGGTAGAGDCFVTNGCVTTSCCITKIVNPGEFVSNPGQFSAGFGH